MGLHSCKKHKYCSPTAKLPAGPLAQNSSGQVSEKVPEGSGGFRSLPAQMADDRVPAQMVDEVPAQMADEVLESFGAGYGELRADRRQGCGGSRGRKLMRIRTFPARWLMRLRKVKADEVLEGCGADCRQGSGGPGADG